jgi:hypothetical protein
MATVTVPLRIYKETERRAVEYTRLEENLRKIVDAYERMELGGHDVVEAVKALLNREGE